MRDLATYAVALLGLGMTAAGCKTLECGDNTVEQDDKCVAMAGQTGTECGPGTHFDMGTGRCEADVFNEGGGVCGEGTAAVVSDAGVRTCVGLGGGGTNCSNPLPCPAPTEANSVAMCGRIYDLEDSKPLDDGNPDNGEPSQAVELLVLDPFEFIRGNATPKARALADSCGRYAIQNAPRPTVGFIALAVDDLDPNGPDRYVTTGIAAAVASGDVLPAQRAWILRRTTDQMWSAAAGLTGMTFGQVGVYIPLFIGSGAPVAPFPGPPVEGVMTAVIEGTARVAKPENDFYFDDTDPTIRRMVSTTRPSTGKNGSGLYINQATILFPGFSGIGSTPMGTCWAVNPAAAPMNAAFVQERQYDSRFCQ